MSTAVLNYKRGWDFPLTCRSFLKLISAMKTLFCNTTWTAGQSISWAIGCNSADRWFFSMSEGGEGTWPHPVAEKQNSAFGHDLKLYKIQKAHWYLAEFNIRNQNYFESIYWKLFGKLKCIFCLSQIIFLSFLLQFPRFMYNDEKEPFFSLILI